MRIPCQRWARAFREGRACGFMALIVLFALRVDGRSAGKSGSSADEIDASFRCRRVQAVDSAIRLPVQAFRTVTEATEDHRGGTEAHAQGQTP